MPVASWPSRTSKPCGEISTSEEGCCDAVGTSLRPCVSDVDDDLVEALRRAEPDGPERLLERYGDRIYRLALCITGVEEDAAEAVEDTLRTTVRTIHTLIGEPAFGSWISRTAAKAAYQRLRMRRP